MQSQRDGGSTASTLLVKPVQMSNSSLLMSHTEWLDVGALHGEAEYPPDAIVNHHDLGKGLSWALAIEAAATLIVYAIWHVCHMLF